MCSRRCFQAGLSTSLANLVLYSAMSGASLSASAQLWPAAAQEAGPVAEQLQVLQIALVNEQCTAAQHTAPLAGHIWRQHLQARQTQPAGARRLISVCALYLTVTVRDVVQRACATHSERTFQLRLPYLLPPRMQSQGLQCKQMALRQQSRHCHALLVADKSRDSSRLQTHLERLPGRQPSPHSLTSCLQLLRHPQPDLKPLVSRL